MKISEDSSVLRYIRNEGCEGWYLRLGWGGCIVFSS